MASVKKNSHLGPEQYLDGIPEGTTGAASVVSELEAAYRREDSWISSPLHGCLLYREGVYLIGPIPYVCLEFKSSDGRNFFQEKS